MIREAHPYAVLAPPVTWALLFFLLFGLSLGLRDRSSGLDPALS